MFQFHPHFISNGGNKVTKANAFPIYLGFIISHPGCTSQHLRKHTGSTIQSVIRMIDNLEYKGLIKTGKERPRPLYPTELGKKIWNTL